MPGNQVTGESTADPTKVGEDPTVSIDAAAPAGTPPTELRVHGVSGSPVEEMLDRPLIGQVAGDSDAGFFRPRSEYGGTLGPGGARLEAYRWGNLTAGAAARAFWLLLLPFALVNVALWLRPPAVGLGRRMVHGLIRVFALTVSGTLTLTAVGLVMDLFAWQCASPGSNCQQHQAWVTFFFTGFFASTGRRLAVAALGPILLVSLLWFLGRRTWSRYESFGSDRTVADEAGLATPTFWSGRAQVSRLRGLHVATMFAVVDAALMFVLTRHDQFTPLAGTGSVSATGLTVAGRAVFYTCLAVIGIATSLLLVPAVFERVSTSVTAARISDALLYFSIALTVVSVGYGLLPRTAWPTSGGLPGYGDTVTVLFAAQCGLIALLLLVVAFQRHRAKGALLAGFGAPIVASLGLGVGVTLTSGASYRVADFLAGSSVPTASQFGHAITGLQPPVSYQWAAVGYDVTVAVLILAGLWVLFVTRPALVRSARLTTNLDYPDCRLRDPGRASEIDTATATAGLTDRVSRTIGLVWVVLGACGIVATVLAILHKGPVQLFTANSVGAHAVSILINVGTYLISLSVLGLLFLGVQTYRNSQLRRTVGVAWDLTTFWPRSAHPLAPPCYAERVVPELVYRATWLARDQGGVILSSHSQGTVLAAAAVLQMSPEARANTALLTYGSPITRLYARAFPNYFNADVLRDIAARVTGPNGERRWINLWRRTDPIGGPIGGPVASVDRRLPDPSAYGPIPGDRVPPKVAAHNHYPLDPRFGAAVADLIDRLPT
jgi:hypothetical protein